MHISSESDRHWIHRVKLLFETRLGSPGFCFLKAGTEMKLGARLCESCGNRAAISKGLGDSAGIPHIRQLPQGFLHPNFISFSFLLHLFFVLLKNGGLMKYWTTAGRAYSQSGDSGVNGTPGLGLRARLRPVLLVWHFPWDMALYQSRRDRLYQRQD